MTDVKKYTVYILEENKDLLNNIKDSLIATNNFTVIGTSDNATSCLNYLSNNNCDLLIIDLDGLDGYPSSFFEEAFGGIARLYSPQDVLKSISFECSDNPLVIDDMISYINQEYAKKKNEK